MQLVDNYETFEKEFLDVLNKHAPLKKKFVRGNYVFLHDKDLASSYYETV